MNSQVLPLYWFTFPLRSQVTGLQFFTTLPWEWVHLSTIDPHFPRNITSTCWKLKIEQHPPSHVNICDLYLSSIICTTNNPHQRDPSTKHKISTSVDPSTVPTRASSAEAFSGRVIFRAGTKDQPSREERFFQHRCRTNLRPVVVICFLVLNNLVLSVSVLRFAAPR